MSRVPGAHTAASGDEEGDGPPVDWADHFVVASGPQAVHRARCRHCRHVIHGQRRGSAKYGHHMGHCASLPPDVRRVLDDYAVASFKAGDVRYADLYESFEVTGWMVARCLRCDAVLRGDSATVVRHAPACPGKPAAVPNVGVEQHFTHSQDEGITLVHSVCVHCGHSLARRSHADVLPLRRHLGRCRSLPPDTRAELDAAAVRDASEHAGQYARGSVYDGFTVTGFMRATCSLCGGTVRGGAGDLLAHAKRCVAGKTRLEGRRAADVAKGHFTAAEGGTGRSVCVHCGADVRAKPASNLKQHMARCKRLPHDARAALDTPALLAYAEHKGVYADEQMRLHFRAVGYSRDECTACGTQVTGGRGKMRRHLLKCDAAKRVASTSQDGGQASSDGGGGAGGGSGGRTKRRRDSSAAGTGHDGAASADEQASDFGGTGDPSANVAGRGGGSGSRAVLSTRTDATAPARSSPAKRPRSRVMITYA